MKTVHVNLGKRSYDILIGEDLLGHCHQVFKRYGVQKRIFLVCNTHVFRLFGESVLRHLSRNDFQVTEILIPDGEKYKNLHTVENIYTYLIAQRADRSSTLAALGGGVTGDIAGFVAATFLRGIPYVQIPTTLVSQVDSSVGGKTGVNHQLGKNMIGAFYQPHLVYVDTDTLSTLPQREFLSGLFEVVKYGLIHDEEFFNYFESHVEEIKRRDASVLMDVVSRCCEIKAEIISSDETEQDLRRILNFGHTLGHAIEAATHYQGLTHGEAVGYGMLAAARLSQLKGYLDESTCERINQCIRSIGDLPAVDFVATKDIVEAMHRDKKRQSEQLVFVLLKSIGKAMITREVEEDEILRVWEQTKHDVWP